MYVPCLFVSQITKGRKRTESGVKGQGRDRRRIQHEQPRLRMMRVPQRGADVSVKEARMEVFEASYGYGREKGALLMRGTFVNRMCNMVTQL